MEEQLESPHQREIAAEINIRHMALGVLKLPNNCGKKQSTIEPASTVKYQGVRDPVVKDSTSNFIDKWPCSITWKNVPRDSDKEESFCVNTGT